MEPLEFFNLRKEGIKKFSIGELYEITNGFFYRVDLFDELNSKIYFADKGHHVTIMQIGQNYVVFWHLEIDVRFSTICQLEPKIITEPNKYFMRL